MAIFNAKNFNGEVFTRYYDTIPNPNLTELIKSRAIRERPDLAAAMADQTGGNYITTPMSGRISGSIPVNYDGATNITADTTKTFSQSRVVVGRAKAWSELDFSYDVTGGYDAMEAVAQQIAEYWSEIDQATLVHILNGVFHMSDTEGLKFVAEHTYDVTERQNSEGVTGVMDGTTLNTGMQRACGDGKGKFALACMHSAVATNLENLKVLAYLKYTDANGIERDLALATLNGRAVLVDDSMPKTETETTAEVKGTYTITISTAGASGDKVNIGGVEYTFGTTTSFANKTIAVGSSATTQATALKGLLAQQYDGTFTVTSAAGVVTLTQLVGGTGAKPSFSVGSGATLSAAIADGTTGVARVVKTTYTTYVLGDGAIEYTNCGAKVPFEMDRNPAVNGGEDVLYSRQRKCFAPFGISFTKASMASLSPTDDELELGANWKLVNTNEDSGETYIARKTVPIARIISLG